MMESVEPHLPESPDDCLRRRLGKFFISQELIEERGLLWATLVLHGCFVVRAERLWDRDGIEYMAIHHAFDEVELGMKAPWYDIVIDENKTGFRRRD